MPHLTNVRYGYFDALRGLSMILVVFHHVMLISIGIEDGINHFFYSFRMPLFFFISGFFAYKSLDAWNKDRITDIVARKFKVQIVGASIFLSAYMIFILKRLPDYHSFLDPGEYWFTFTLFRIFIGYMFIVLISRFFRQSEKAFSILLISVAAICVGLYLWYDELIKFFQWSSQSEAILYQVFYKRAICYFPYFTLGLIARANIDRFEILMSNNVLTLFVLISVLLVWSLINLDYLQVPLGNSPWNYPLGLLTLVLVVQFFYNRRIEFDTKSQLSKSMRFIGRRTLDIYFIHYFFLPDLQFLKPYLDFGNQIMLQLVIGGVVSLLIIGITLVVGEVLRMSPVLALWLFGVNRCNLFPNRPEKF